jgi:L-seryl-tRNA(Ser) seleniumtransferase
MFRAFRADKLIYAAMEATLRSYLAGQLDAIPALAMMRLDVETIGARAHRIAQGLAGSSGLKVEVVDGESVIGGGAAPGSVLPTRLLSVSSPQASPNSLAAKLRAYAVPIVARVEGDRLLLDLRTVFAAQDDSVLEALRWLTGERTA